LHPQDDVVALGVHEDFADIVIYAGVVLEHLSLAL
jgi:hypothetical protein